MILAPFSSSTTIGPWTSGDNAGGGSPAVVPEFTLVTLYEQGASPYDPSGLATGPTTDNAGAGTLIFDIPGSTTVIDGWREACPRWTVQLTTLWPDFDPLVDIIDVVQTGLDGIPLDAIGHGLMHGLIDLDTPSLASSQGSFHFARGLNGTTITTGSMGATASSASNNQTGLMLRMYSRHWWVPDAASLKSQARCVVRPNASSNWVTASGNAAAYPSMNVTTANWRLTCGYMHTSSTLGAIVLTTSLYARRIRVAALGALA